MLAERKKDFKHILLKLSFKGNMTFKKLQIKGQKQESRGTQQRPKPLPMK